MLLMTSVARAWGWNSGASAILPVSGKKKEKEKERKEATHTSNMSLVTQKLASARQFGMGERMLESQEVYALISAKNVK